MKDLARLLLWYPVRWLLAMLPLALARPLTDLAGRLAAQLRRRRVRIAAGEVELLLGPRAGASAAARRGVAQATANLLQTCLYPRLAPATIDELTALAGGEHLAAAVAGGHGAILLLAHFGFNQLAMAALGHRGFTIHQIGAAPLEWHRLTGQTETRAQARASAVRLALERSLPARILYLEESMRPAIEVLRAGGILIAAFDGRAGSQWLKVPVCRRVMNVASGPFSLARLTGAAILPLFMERLAGGRHLARIEPPLAGGGGDGAGRGELYESQARAFAAILSGHLERRPDHYAALMAETRLRAPLDPVPLFADLERGR